ncbi:hypothetical protein SBA3_290038 [Candidatus Sulfopaludibacter sp. SbA3]|nr:hypothetical protein SBA3_290038 [Candidatus Sulfopaludibacter sp. SbA3]
MGGGNASGFVKGAKPSQARSFAKAAKFEPGTVLRRIPALYVSVFATGRGRTLVAARRIARAMGGGVGPVIGRGRMRAARSKMRKVTLGGVLVAGSDGASVAAEGARAWA